LDRELPGESFFTRLEVNQRADSRIEDDAVQRGMDAFFASERKAKDEQSAARREMTFQAFRRLWGKINSRLKASIDPALVWLEIKSYIKGSITALHLQDRDRNRFLSLSEYLALPRKQSRIDETQRRLVYDLYRAYEKLKKTDNYYDEMDIVYNLAGRIPAGRQAARKANEKIHGLLPVDAVFIDEVQDFTQGELYLLTKLCSDPNNLMMAGDTAQSIAVGVGFRFTDVRQIFYKSFGGIEPDLLRLTHNYRSHSGILRLAASVVELLYHFFSDSLDKLPPDFGLFPGPKPVIMEVSSVSDLVLMLDGSKRETSRIEFGAHQVVIVRNEEAKQSLPEEFGVDKDWVMTVSIFNLPISSIVALDEERTKNCHFSPFQVQQSKGLEFDDVLLYNFFTDSPAEDLWRVVSNYNRDDGRAYHHECGITSASVQSFEWEDLDPGYETRRLDFDREKHKILESEFKMLYTSITRARVNVFIAETNVSLCQPMFNYFKQRRLVESVKNNSAEGLSGIRVFGQPNTIEDWRNRGDYYLQKTV
jgi:superfamily I DNA/RNA helicase